MANPRGISVHIGVNIVDPRHYGGSWDGQLNACENDCADMQRIAARQGFETHSLKSAQATRAAVTNAIRGAAGELQGGDFFLLTYSGHGGTIPDVDGDEEDQVDETWCLFDGQLLDDELNILWSEFEAGVRLLVVSDSCHSGTMLRDLNFADLQRRLPDPRPEIKATVRLLSGCQEDELSWEGSGNGRFTEALKETYADGRFEGDYRTFHRAIEHQLKDRQRPNHVVRGTPDPEYDHQHPFKI
jgi:hypothetical protein